MIRWMLFINIVSISSYIMVLRFTDCLHERSVEVHDTVYVAPLLSEEVWMNSVQIDHNADYALRTKSTSTVVTKVKSKEAEITNHAGHV